MTRSVHHTYLTAFSFLIVIETCTFLGLIYPYVASILNPSAELGGEIIRGGGIKIDPFQIPLTNTLMLMYISVAAN